MNTIETAIVMPVILFFLVASVCISLKYTELLSEYSERLAASCFEECIGNAAVTRCGDLLSDLYENYAG